MGLPPEPPRRAAAATTADGRRRRRVPALRDAVRAVPGVLPRVRPAPSGHARAHPGPLDRLAPARPLVPRATGSGRCCGALIVAALAAAIAILATTRQRLDETSTQRRDRPAAADHGPAHRRRRPTTAPTPTVPTATDGDRDRASRRLPAAAADEMTEWPAGPERLDDRARLDPAERGPRGGQRARRSKAIDAGLTDVGVLNSSRVLEPAPGLLRRLQRDLQLGERGPSRARHGEGSYPQAYARQIAQ